MNWVDVVDTTVKIGLGALIGGGFGYVTAKLNHDAAHRSRSSERRSAHLEAILKLLSEVEVKFAHQKWRLESYRFYLANEETEAAEKHRQAFEIADQELYAATDRFHHASSVLLLLGQSETDALLWQYRDAVNDWLQWSTLDPARFPEEQKVKVYADARSARSKVFASLASLYDAR